MESMTGFGEATIRAAGYVLKAEAYSLNHKHLNIKISLPPGWKYMEPIVHNAIIETIKRGTINFYIWEEKAPEFHIEIEPVKKIKETLQKAGIEVTICLTDLTSLGFMRRGVPPKDIVEKLVLKTLDNLVKSRRREGKKLEKFILKKLKSLSEKLAEVKKILEKLPAEEKEKNCTEEIERLEIHLSTLKEVIKEENPGRKIEFLANELLREASTLLAKSPTASVSKLAMEMRWEAEGIRQQASNVQ